MIIPMIIGVANVDLAFLVLLVLLVAQLALPLEACAVLAALVNQALHDVSRVHVNRTQRHNLLAAASASHASQGGGGR